MIDNSAITTDKINAGAVTTAKINSGAVTSTEIGDNAVITTKINDDAVSYAKIQNISTANRLLGSTTANGEVSEVRITNDMITDSTIDLTTKVSGVLPIENFATKDEDDMASNSATHVPTQQSVKAYVDFRSKWIRCQKILSCSINS